MPRHSSLPSGIAVIITTVLALAIALPAGRVMAATWLPAADFAIGTAMVTLAFLQVARAASAWLGRSASLPWLAAGLTVAAGLFVAGSAQMLDAQSHEFNWVALAGIVVTLAGVQWQRRCALR